MSFVIGNRLPTDSASAFDGGLTSLNGHSFYRIANVDEMQPFFVNVVSHCDLWMYQSSRSGLVAGRVSAENSLFPYETVDRLHDGHNFSGPITMMWLDRGDGGLEYWQPFCDFAPGAPQVQRNLLKNLVGNQLVFEEIHATTGLVFRSRWSAADSLGIVRTITVTNTGDQPVQFNVLDGLRHVMPAGVSLGLTQGYSCLVDAYKRNECDLDSGLGIFATTATISDGTHPVESLRANVVWSGGEALPVNLSDDAIGRFQRCLSVGTNRLVAGRRGNYLVMLERKTLEPGESLRWDLVADMNLGHREIVALRQQLRTERPGADEIDARIDHATLELARNVASADGLQETAESLVTAHHFSNVLFNNMRGGVFDRNYDISCDLYRDSIRSRSRAIATKHADFLAGLPESISLSQLVEQVRGTECSHLLRLTREYLPIRFSRRHGDPSRPWNRFSIRLKDAAGKPLLKYEGNWRDIFQNWEGLCSSFPDFLPSIISKFVSGSTVDGYNPYRVTDEGLEWEEPEPDEPWANIGYWGDHQIIYLLKLLEATRDRQPETLTRMLTQSQFAYVNVPYRLKSYPELVENGRDTIRFDAALNASLMERASEHGEDGKLWWDADGNVVLVNLTEKLLVPMLSKLSNLVVGAGIWMNTQRPEWNDANNALVGNGVSLVTLAYLRRYLKFFGELLDGLSEESVAISESVADWGRQVLSVLDSHASVLGGDSDVSDATRRQLLDELGAAFDGYRQVVYAKGPGSAKPQSLAELRRLCDVALRYTDHTIRLNQREDTLYHSYNLIEFGDGELKVQRLYEMLEGQVAVLSSGCLSTEESVDLMDALFLSRMYRADQNSFMLYPDRELPDFLDRNVVEESVARENPLLVAMLDEGDVRIVAADGEGKLRFSSGLSSCAALEEQLNAVSNEPQWESLVSEHRQSVIDLYSQAFGHDSYTGRSGTMYGYEGLGCIYWHMVSKLLLAVQENYQAADDAGASSAERLHSLYYRVRDGLGFQKSPEEFGAFPTDAYSHTSGHSGARQPGMTGQVKEEVLTRWGELGVRVRAGRLEFRPTLLRLSELLSKAGCFEYFDVNGKTQALDVPVGSLAFTYCQVPVLYRRTQDGETKIVVHLADGGTVSVASSSLDEELTQFLLRRSGQILKVEVDF